MKKGQIYLNEKNDSKIEIQRRTNKNYTHMVNIDSKIVSITAWRNSKLKFRLNLITNILTLGILHIFSLFNPKLYIKLYCKESLPKNSDFFLIEDIYNNFTLCKTIYRKSSKKKISLNSNSQNNEKRINISISFEYNSIKYKYDSDTNSVVPVFFNLSLYKNNTIINTFGEGINNQKKLNNLIEKYGRNIMDLNNKLIFENFLKNDIPQCISVFVSGGICFICRVFAFGALLMILSVLVILIKIFYRCIKFIKKLGHDYSLDGINEYKVKRKFIKENKINGFSLIKNIDLVPGDILSLGEGETMPCDGIILDGECVLSETKIFGKIDNTIRNALESNNNYFSYENNKNSIIFHGAEILKIYSKDVYKRILVLVINTGINTFKGNLLSNLLYKKIINKKSNNLYDKIKEKNYLIFLVVLYISSSIGIICRYILTGKNYSFFNHIALNLGLTLMPIYYIIICSIKYLGIFNLNNDDKESIQCIDESRLIESGKINRVIFDKTGTLTENNLEISSFIPLYYDHSSLKFYFKIYDKKNIKKICDEHIKFYKNYLLNKKKIEDFQNFQLNTSEELKSELIDSFREKNLNNDNTLYELSALFLQCLICCTNLAKINNEICGNIIEKEIIDIIKWDINTVELSKENNEVTNYNNFEYKENIIDKIHRMGSIFFKDSNNINNNYNYNYLNIINEVFPKNYYKITEGMKININNDINKMVRKNIKDDNFYRKNKIIPFKLIIINRFFNNSFTNISCIVYNFIEDNYRFMAKGPPEKILKHCINGFLPDIEKLLSKTLKEGYRVIACATKIIQYNNEDKNQTEDFYLKDLTFCGFILFKNNLKEESKQIIENIKKMECDVAISTGDGLINTIETGLKVGLFNEKNIFIFDVNNKLKKQKIFVTSISNFKKEEEKESNKDSKNIKDNSDNLELDDINISKNVELENINEKERSKLNQIKKKKSFINLKFNKNKTKIKKVVNNEQLSSSRKMIKNKEFIFNNNEINKNEENESSSIDVIDTSHFDEVNNSPMSYYFNDGINSSSYNNINNINKVKTIHKCSGSTLINDFSSEQKNIKNLIVNEIEQNKINSPQIRKKVNLFPEKNSFAFRGFRLDSFAHFQNFSHKSILKNRTPNKKYSNKSLEISKDIKSNKSPNKSNIHKGNKEEKINNNNNNLINNTGFPIKYDFSNNKQYFVDKRIYFEYSLDKIKYFIDGCTLCFSGIALKYIYDKRKKKEIQILLKLMNKYGKLFFSMSSYQKSLLIKINKEIFNKKICMVGDGTNDIDAIMSSNVGIYIGQQKNLNTLLSHYFINENSLMNIETIIKNGRGYYENDNLLLPANFLFTACWVGLITYSYFLEKTVDNVMLTLLNLSIFILCVSAFTIKPDYKIYFNYLASNSKLLKYYKLIRFLGVLIIKIICQIVFYFTYDYNESIDMGENKEIILSYIFIMTWSQSMSSVLVFNISSFYRKSFLSNLIFLIIYILIFLYILYLLTLNDVSLGKIKLINISFEFTNNNIDFFDDYHKLTVLYIISADIILPCILVIILKIVFENKARNLKNNIEIKEKKE